MINPIRRKIKEIKISQRSRHDKIIIVLNDILTLIEERCGKDILIDEIIEAMKGDKHEEDGEAGLVSEEQPVGSQDEPDKVG